MARLVEERHQPLYTQPTEKEWRSLDGLLVGKKLPDRDIAGPLDAQRHVAIAGARALRRDGYVHVVAEVGFGKTAVALMATVLLDAWPALVLCPAHLVKKWARETAEVVPGARSVILASVGDVEAFVGSYRPGDRPLCGRPRCPDRQPR